MSNQPADILIVEDTYALLQTYKAYLKQEEARVRGVETGQQAMEEIQAAVPDVIVLDVNLPDMHGIDVLKAIRAEGLTSEVVVITGQASVNLAVEAMREGAFDFIMKPFSADRLRTTIRNALERRELSELGSKVEGPDQEQGLSNIIGKSESMQAVYRMLRAVAPTNASVFIRGESGTGKELCAEAVHQLSKRSTGPMVTINCAAIPKDLLESEIFGHIKGAFTGATSDRKGAALSADKGTLFLDEVCEMDLSLQSKLLRFLQEKQVQRVGEDRLRDADVRIVCATNRDPVAEVAAGRFREDLYYRLHVVPIDLPPLRNRGMDILLMARHFLGAYAQEDGKRFTRFSPEAEQALMAFSWPGNIRQLQNVLRSAVVLNDGDVLERYMLPPDIAEGSVRSLPKSQPSAGHRVAESPAHPSLHANGDENSGVSPPSYGHEAGAAHAPLRQQGEVAQQSPLTLPFQSESRDASRILPLETVIRLTIEDAIDRCNGSIPRAAAALEVSPSTIYRRLQAWELEDQVAQNAQDDAQSSSGAKS
ncbi:sigma-54 dependent transcriptional regulator [Pseudovibrio exalbescens]|uniref:sigma-54-dependent transcriptional regulator n=1 Tax=Pseudovibrio exalbescens TaxID=197461 RepID=UPI002366AD17|nr:sigma-54 dependent transcriptional regulator [Pseudovibrio exalbescens]MDD7909223.1 sigma-54 dependent transcriptional regulator [Pseudovibrio exalbescens]